MLNAQGKPRYWLGSYDAWHLLIPLALVVVLAAWAMAPKPAAPRRTVAAVLPPLTPSTILQPQAGSTVLVRQFSAIQGTCHPQTRVFLFLRQIPNPETLLAETRSGTNGVFQFTMAPFPPGDYGFRVEAVATDGRRAASSEISVRLTTEPAPAPPKKPQGTPATPKAAGKKSSPAKPTKTPPGGNPKKPSVSKGPPKPGRDGSGRGND
jgi:hypothetical protein